MNKALNIARILLIAIVVLWIAQAVIISFTITIGVFGFWGGPDLHNLYRSWVSFIETVSTAEEVQRGLEIEIIGALYTAALVTGITWVVVEVIRINGKRIGLVSSSDKQDIEDVLSEVEALKGQMNTIQKLLESYQQSDQ